ncbi:cytochrome P450 3A4-like isoform X1 [Mytilus trossulus]|uniref:cytochrome P450 3A4-like isoform X1 n=2 Tax=Mytilus trossulus TaxID=6551 RepID=UPI0030061992
MEILAITAIVLLFIYLYRKMRKTYSVFETLRIPGPKPVWILGNIHEFKDEDKLSMFKIWRKQYGDVYGFYEGFKPSVVVCDPELSRLILVKHFEKFHIRPIYNPFLYYPDEYSLLNEHGTRWKTQRKAVVAAFNSLPINSVSERLCETTAEFTDILSDAAFQFTDGFDIGRIVDRYTLDAFANAAFDYKVNSMKDENATLYQFMKVFNESSSADNPVAGLARVYDSLVPFLQLFDTKHKRTHIQHIHELRELIEKRQEQGQQPVIDNVIDYLLFTKITDTNNNNQQRHLTVEEIVAHLNSITGGGFGTTNAALSFVLHQLTVNPDVQDKLFQEIKHNCGLFDNPDVDSIHKMKYLDNVINETLRILPCAPGVARTCTEDCTINGVEFRKGMVLRIMLCPLYADETIYPEPEQFKPERFDDDQKNLRHPNSFLPFGQGPRICPGYRIALTLMKIAIIFIIRQFVLKPCEKTKDPLPTALRPMLVPRDGVYVKLQLRNNNMLST